MLYEKYKWKIKQTEWDHIYVGPFNHYVHNVDHHNCIIEAT